MSLYRDDALVLRLHKLGEADRIVTLLSHRLGKLRAVARGVAKTTSRIGGRLEPFSHVDVQCYSSDRNRSSLHTIRQTETIHAYGKTIMGDYPRYTAASAIVETADRLSGDEGEPAPQLFMLTVGALRSMSAGEHAPGLVLDAYLLRAMAVAGWAPALIQCAVCGVDGRHRAFSVPAGGAVCSQCRPAGSASASEAAYDLMVALLSGDWAAADASQQPARRETSGLIAAHLQWHTERDLRSLPLVHRA
ncbi:MAG: DNA repair protein RecO [Mycobacteriales bacterium]